MSVNYRRVFFSEGISSGTLMFTNGVPYTYQNGLAVFSPEYAMPAQTQVSITYLNYINISKTKFNYK